MKRISLTILALAACWAANAQSFVQIDNDARSAAMGSTGVSSPAEGLAIYNNSAAIALSKNTGAVSYSYSPYMWDFKSGNNLHSIAGFYKINQKHALTAGVRYFNKANVVLDNNKTAKPSDLSIELGYAFRINDMMGISANVRFMNMEPDISGMDAGTAVGFDLGYYFKKNRLSAGLVLSNVGSKYDFGDEKYDTPSWVKAGAAYEWLLCPKHVLTGSVQFDYNFQPSDEDGFEAGLGVEYMYNNIIAVRGGFRLADDTMDYNYGTAGFGVNLGCANLGFTYIFAGKDEPLNKTMLMSVGFKF